MRGTNGVLGKEVRAIVKCHQGNKYCALTYRMLELEQSYPRRYGTRVQFLMVCVDGVRVAKEFGRMFDLKAVVNCYIPSRGYMPVG